MGVRPRRRVVVKNLKKEKEEIKSIREIGGKGKVKGSKTETD